MKPILKKITANSLSLDNSHLLDVLNNDKYIEIGNINYKTFEKLLAGKLIKLEDLSFFSIQNIGLGGSKITSEKDSELINKLPFLALANNVKSHSSRIVVITYGILVQFGTTKDFSSREEFTPMVLIPVEMYIDGEDINFQMISQPFVNPNINSIKNLNSRTINNDVVNNIYNIDKFCLSYNNLQDVRLESYISYINLKGANTKFRTNLFNESLNLYPIDNHYNIDNTSLINITPLNKYQRNALEKAHEGHSFEIAGAIGTGKTTALVNIAADAFYNNKRVLYLSSRVESLKEAYKILEDKELNGIASRLYLPFKTLKEKYYRASDRKSTKELYNENLGIRTSLKALYERSEKFIGYLYKRINNFYVIDVINQCIKYRDLKTSFPEGTLEGISKIYHEELNQVITSLQDIDENKMKLDSFKNSIYSQIPTNIKFTVEEIMELLTSLKEQFTKIEKYKNELINTYGFRDVENYAFLRSCLNNHKVVNKDLIPDVWLKYDENGLYDFNKAKTVFLSFRNEMEELASQIKEIKDNYDVKIAYSLDLEKDTEYLYTRFKANKQNIINAFLADNKKIIDILDSFIKTIEISEANFDKMNKAIKSKINFSDDKLVRHILSFMNFIYENKYSKEWLKLDNKKAIVSKIEENRVVLKQYEEDKRALGISDTKHLSEYVDNLKFKKIFKLRDKKFKENFDKANELLRTSKVIDSIYADYLKYVGEEYSDEVNGINKYTEFVKRIEAIEDLSVRKGIITMMESLDYDDCIEEIAPFIAFSDYYDDLDNKHHLLCEYSLVNDKSNYRNRIKDILEAFEYCKNVEKIQENVRRAMKIKGEYTSLEDINILKLRIDRQHRIEESINKNTEYKRLLTSKYDGYKSNVNDIDKLIENFQLYQSNYKDWSYVASSFENRKKLDKLVDDCYDLCQEVVEGIKNYSKYFKNTTDDFYYNSFKDIFKLFKVLIAQRTELEVYVKVSEALDDLEKMGLHNLYDYIIDKYDKEINYCDTFLKEYFANLLKMFEDKNPEFRDIDANYELLDEIIKTENEFIESNIDILQNKQKNKYNIFNLNNMDYNNYITKTAGIKWIFFATPTILNYFIDAGMFDLILIDEAQLLDSNEYIKVVSAKQLIVAGVPQVSFGITDDLLSIMKRTATIKMKHRYEATPINLLNNFERLKGMFPVYYDNNNGIIQSKLSIEKEVKEIINNNHGEIENIKINIFMEDDDKIKCLYDDLTECMINYGLDQNIIYKFMNENLNICSLNRHYSISSDYNILNIYDYKDMNDRYEIINYINIISSVKRKLIICDPQGILNLIEKKSFLKQVDDMISNKIEFNKIYQDESIQKLVKKLKASKVEVMGSIGNYGLVLRHKNVLSGIIFFDIESLHESSVLNLYRNLKYGNGIECISIFLIDLEKNFDACVDRIIAMTKNAKALMVDEAKDVDIQSE